MNGREGHQGYLPLAYEDAPKELSEAWTSGESRISEYTDELGTFRSLFLPVKEPLGQGPLCPWRGLQPFGGQINNPRILCDIRAHQ